jgi:hypothetical protein
MSTREKYYRCGDVAESSGGEKSEKHMNTALIMTDVAAALPGTRPYMVLRTLAPLVDPKIYRWILDWLSD